MGERQKRRRSRRECRGVRQGRCARGVSGEFAVVWASEAPTSNISECSSSKRDPAPSPATRMGRSCSYELMEPLHRLWLGYISELLGLTFRDAMSPSQAAAAIGDQTSDSPKDQAASTEADAGSSTVAVTFETKSVLQDNVPLNQMQGWQAKLVKADFHGAKVEGTLIKASWAHGRGCRSVYHMHAISPL